MDPNNNNPNTNPFNPKENYNNNNFQQTLYEMYSENNNNNPNGNNMIYDYGMFDLNNLRNQNVDFTNMRMDNFFGAEGNNNNNNQNNNQPNLNQSINNSLIQNGNEALNKKRIMEEQYSQSVFNQIFRNNDPNYRIPYFAYIPRSTELEKRNEIYVLPQVFCDKYPINEYRDIVKGINCYENNNDRNKKIDLNGISYSTINQAISSRYFSGFMKVMDICEYPSFEKYLLSIKFNKTSMKSLEFIGSVSFGLEEVFICKFLLYGVNPLLFDKIIQIHHNLKNNWMLCFSKASCISAPYTLNINKLQNCNDLVFICSAFTKLFMIPTNDNTLYKYSCNQPKNTFYVSDAQPNILMDNYLVESLNRFTKADYNMLIKDYLSKTNEIEKAKYDFLYYLETRVNSNYFNLYGSVVNNKFVAVDLPAIKIDEPYEVSKTDIIGIVSMINNERTNQRKVSFFLNSIINEESIICEIKDINIAPSLIRPQMVVGFTNVNLKIDVYKNMCIQYDPDSSMKIYGYIDDSLLSRIIKNNYFRFTPLKDFRDLLVGTKIYKINRKRLVQANNNPTINNQNNDMNQSALNNNQNNMMNMSQYQVPSYDPNNMNDSSIVSFFTNINQNNNNDNNDEVMVSMNNMNRSINVGYQPKEDIQMTDEMAKNNEIKEEEIFDNKKPNQDDSINFNFEDILADIEAQQNQKYKKYTEIIEKSFPLLVRRTYKYYVNIERIIKIELINKDKNNGIFMYQKRLLNEGENIIFGETYLEEKFNSENNEITYRYAVTEKELKNRDIIIYAEITDTTSKGFCEFRGQAALSLINKVKGIDFIEMLENTHLINDRLCIYYEKRETDYFKQQEIVDMTAESFFMYATPKSRCTTVHDPLREGDILKHVDRAEFDVNRSFNDLCLNNTFGYYNGYVAYKKIEDIIDLDTLKLKNNFELIMVPWFESYKILTGLERKVNFTEQNLFL